MANEFGLEILRWYHYPQLVVMSQGRPWILSEADSKKLLQQIGSSQTIESFPSYSGNTSASGIGLQQALQFDQEEKGRVAEKERLRLLDIETEKKNKAAASAQKTTISPDQYTGKTFGMTSGGKQLYELKNGDVTSQPPPSTVKITGDAVPKFSGPTADQVIANTEANIANQSSPQQAGQSSGDDSRPATPQEVREAYITFFDRVPTLEEFEHHAQKKTPVGMLNEWASTHPQAGAAQTGAPTPSAPQQTAAPAPSKTQQQQQTGMPPVDPRYEFAGEQYSLVKFSDDPTPSDPASDSSTVWMFNNVAKTYTPFISMDALREFYEARGSSLEQAVKDINTIPTTELNKPNSTWAGQFQSTSMGINVGNGGVAPTQEQAASVAGAQYRYGQQPNAELQSTVASWMGALFTSMKNEHGALSQATFDSIFKDAAKLAEYTSAVAYGGYTFGDVYRDVKAQELGMGVRAISDFVPASQFYNTPESIQVRNNASLQPPTNIDIDPNIFNLPIFQIPGQAFSTIIKPIDFNSPEFKAEAEKIQASWYDLLLQQAEASTQQDLAIAQDNWNRFKEDLERKYGWQLSDNATQAWTQVNELTNNFGARGLGTSGMLEEARDKYLRQVQETDDRLRTEKASEKDLEDRNRLLQSGTPEEIAALSDDLKVKYGLKPSQEVLDFATKNPELKGILIDDSGNYRSQLFQTMFINKFDTGQQKTGYQQQQLLNQKLIEEEKAYAPFTRSQNPFSSYQPDYAAGEKSEIPNFSDSYLSGLKKSNLPYIVPTPSSSISGAQTQSQPAFKSFSLPNSSYERISDPSKIGEYDKVTSPGLDPNDPKALYGVKKQLKSLAG